MANAFSIDTFSLRSGATRFGGQADAVNTDGGKLKSGAALAASAFGAYPARQQLARTYAARTAEVEGILASMSGTLMAVSLGLGEMATTYETADRTSTPGT